MRGSMKLAVTTVTAASACVAAAETILVDWGTALESGEEMIAVGLNGTVLNAACGSRLKLGSSEIAVRANDKAHGSVTITRSSGKMKAQSFDLGDEDICDGFWTSDATQIECRIPWEEDGSEEALIRSSNLKTMDSCFSSTPDKNKRPLSLGEDLADRIEEEEPHWQDFTSESSSAPERTKRQWDGYSEKADPLNAKKWWRYAQLTDSLDCRSANCEIQSSDEMYHEVLGVRTSGELYRWIDGGFKVAEEAEYKASIKCPAKQGERKCVKFKSRFQGYDVETGKRSGDMERVEVCSPLPEDEDKEVTFYCARGNHACKDKYNAVWENHGSGSFDDV